MIYPTRPKVEDRADTARFRVNELRLSREAYFMTGLEVIFFRGTRLGGSVSDNHIPPPLRLVAESSAIGSSAGQLL